MVVTVNLIVSKTTFTRYGLFNSNLISGGDVDWARRVASIGAKVVYNDLIKVIIPLEIILKN